VVDGAAERLRGVIMRPSAEEALEGADAGVLVTEWSSIVNLDWGSLAETMREPVIIDGRNALDPQAMRAHGFRFEGIGRVPGGEPA
jgi:UDPglucose 6-dehydrogenase